MLKLIQTDWGQFDLAVTVPAENTAAAMVETVVYAVLFTDQEAPKNRAESFDRRGWYANPQAGSGLWHVRRQALTDAARREAVSMVRRALKARLPALQNIAVKEEVSNDKAGNISRVSLAVSGDHNGEAFLIHVPL